MNNETQQEKSSVIYEGIPSLIHVLSLEELSLADSVTAVMMLGDTL